MSSGPINANYDSAVSPTKGEAEHPTLPSTRVLAMLAAVMGDGAGPEDALRLWLETERMADAVRSMQPEKRKAVLNMVGRGFRLDDGFEQDEAWDSPKDLSTALNRATVMKSVQDAMEYLGIKTPKTFFMLLRYTWLGTTKKSSKEMEQSLHKKHLEIQDVGIDEDLMCRLRIAQREKKAEAAKKNTANARHKRMRRTVVK